jgi:hypothetical protein
LRLCNDPVMTLQRHAQIAKKIVSAGLSPGGSLCKARARVFVRVHMRMWTRVLCVTFVAEGSSGASTAGVGGLAGFFWKNLRTFAAVTRFARMMEHVVVDTFGCWADTHGH